MGGYVAGPPVMAALLRARPGGGDGAERGPRIHQSRHRPVRGARADFVSGDRRAISRPAAPKLTGLPVREEFFAHSARSRAAATFSILITGGSQGSRTLNQAGARKLAAVPAGAVPGAHRASERAARLRRPCARPSRESGLDGEVLPFIADMPAAFARGRPGGVPLGRGRRFGAGRGRQAVHSGRRSRSPPTITRRATPKPSSAAARRAWSRDAEMTGEKLFALVRELAADPATLERMGAAARQFAQPGAARRAAEILEEVARDRARDAGSGMDRADSRLTVSLTAAQAETIR